MLTKKGILALSIGLALSISPVAHADTTPLMMDRIITTEVRDCRVSGTINMPLIAWGADGVTIAANGNAMRTAGGEFAEAGLDLQLSVVDDFAQQVESYLRCDTPFLRGTLGMVMAAATVTEDDSRSEQVVIFSHSWSAGDGLVAGPGIRRVRDLAGKRIAMQRFGPHPDFVGRVLEDAGLSLTDVEIVWTDDLTGDSPSTPSAVFARGEADAAAVILPDARLLTSGSVGTGAEGSVRGATMIFATLEATTTINDMITVRRDFFEANRDTVLAIVQGLFKAEERVRRFMANDGSTEQMALAAIMANELLGGLPPEEGVFLYRDAITAGWTGNVTHFTDPRHPRRFEVLSEEISGILLAAGVIDRPYELATAGWDYAALAEGLTDVSERQIAAFNPDAAAAGVKALRASGAIDDATRLEFEVTFDPGTAEFPVSAYRGFFDEIVRVASTYSGSIITIEGHVDPLHWLRRQKDGADPQELRAIRVSAKNLSLQRAQTLMQAIIAYADSQGVRLNPDQFTVDGMGIEEPLYNPPTTRDQWLANIRAAARVLTTIAEATEFAPL